jgi:hypothetical protein
MAALEWSFSNFVTRFVSRVWGNLMSSAGGPRNQPYMPAAINRGNIPSIPHFEGYREKCLIVVYFEPWRRQFYFRNLNPRALSGAQLKLHLIQLSAHNTGLFVERGDILASFLVGASERSPLQDGGSEAQETRDGERDGRNDQPLGYSYEWGFVGSLVIGAGAALLGFAMKLGYEAFKTPWLVGPAIGLGVIAVAAIIHGLWYACSGVWG